MPPRKLAIPSLEMSTLKNYLNHYNIDTTIIYWNFKLAKLQCAFLWAGDLNVLNKENDSLYLFMNYLAIKENDRETYVNIKAKLMSIKPNYTTSSVAFYHKHMSLYAEKLDILINEFISEIYNSSNILCFGFSIGIHQWLCSTIVAKKIKLQYPESKIIIFGIDNKETAISYLNNFNQFDFAIWGETENTFLNLLNLFFEKKVEYDSIPGLAFRRDTSEIVVSKNRKPNFVLLSDLSIRPDYSDYFEQKSLYEELSVINPIISIKTSYSQLNYHPDLYRLYPSYKYSVKPIKSIVDEIQYDINIYNIYTFYIQNNNLIENDVNRFNELINALLEIKEQYPDFEIKLASITNLEIKETTISKMMMAGFSRIQIDFESLSEKLLKKSEKKNTFASNLLLCKFAVLHHIAVYPANITIGFPQETSEHILQAIYNLHYLRFFLKERQLKFQISKLEVMHSCKYYKEVNRKSSNWSKESFWKQYLPQRYLKTGDNNATILPILPQKVNPLWNDFVMTESYYIQNNFEYKLFKINNNSVLYKELFNNVVISEFELTLLDWIILETANCQIVDIETILEAIRNFIKKEFLEIEIINVLESLKTERLLYISDDYKEIVSIINTKLII
jgi:radical SAM superfamily enzyme YgiQ (UPF0313 family)